VTGLQLRARKSSATRATTRLFELELCERETNNISDDSHLGRIDDGEESVQRTR
jgi:hypothetical protein